MQLLAGPLVKHKSNKERKIKVETTVKWNITEADKIRFIFEGK